MAHITRKDYQKIKRTILMHFPITKIRLTRAKIDKIFLMSPYPLDKIEDFLKMLAPTTFISKNDDTLLISTTGKRDTNIIDIPIEFIIKCRQENSQL